MSESLLKHTINADLINFFVDIGKAKASACESSTRPSGHLAVRPDGPGHHALTRHITPDSECLPQHTHIDKVRQLAKIEWPKTAASWDEEDEGAMPSMFSTPESSPSRPSFPAMQRDIGLIMPRPGSAAPEHPYRLLNRSVTNPHASRKWVSLSAYIKASDYTKKSNVLEFPMSQNSFRRATITQFPAPYQFIAARTHSRSSSEAGNASLVSDLGSEAGGNSMMLKESAPAADTAISSAKFLSSPMSQPERRGSLQQNSTSAIEELRALQIELKDLMALDYATEQRYLTVIVTFSNVLGRDEALAEISESLRHRAEAKKFTMGRAERLILEREADMIFQKTSSESVSVVEARIDVLQAERSETRDAVAKRLEEFTKRACELLANAQPGGRAVGVQMLSSSPAPPASRTLSSSGN